VRDRGVAAVYEWPSLTGCCWPPPRWPQAGAGSGESSAVDCPAWPPAPPLAAIARAWTGRGPRAPWESGQRCRLGARRSTKPRWSSRPGGDAASRDWRTHVGPTAESVAAVHRAPDARGSPSAPERRAGTMLWNRSLSCHAPLKTLGLKRCGTQIEALWQGVKCVGCSSGWFVRCLRSIQGRLIMGRPDPDRARPWRHPGPWQCHTSLIGHKISSRLVIC
jgi:hypothetical protein